MPDSRPHFPLYLVVFYNNLGALLDAFSDTHDDRLLVEALFLTCTELHRLSLDGDFWKSVSRSLGSDVSTGKDVTLTLRPFDFEEFARMEYGLLQRAAVRPRRIDHLIDTMSKTYEDIQNGKPRKIGKLRKQIRDLGEAACKRQNEFLFADGFPNEQRTGEHLGFVVSCFRIVGGLVVAGGDSFGAIHVPIGAHGARRSVKLGLSISKDGLDSLAG